MNDATMDDWYEANQRYLMAAVAVVREELERQETSGDGRVEGEASTRGEPSVAQKNFERAAEEMPEPAALDTLAEMFGLTPFEWKILLVCAAMELDSEFGPLFARLRGDPKLAYPTFGMALAAFSDAHWSAIMPNAAMRYWRLVEVEGSELLTASPLKIDERILHYLTGFSYMDERLSGIVAPVAADEDLVALHGHLVNRVAEALAQRRGDSELPVIQLCGNEVAGKRAIAANACAGLGLGLHCLSASDIPASSREVAELIRLWEREVALSDRALLLNCDRIAPTDVSRLSLVANFCERTQSPIIISSSGHRYVMRRPTTVFTVDKPTSKEQDDLWKSALGTEAEKLNGQFEALTSQFNFGTEAIRSASSDVLGKLSASRREDRDSSDDVGRMLWDACRARMRPRLDDLAQRIEPTSTWDDIVLPEQQKRLLREVVIHVRQRMKVYEEWGFAAKSCRGLGISALFAGESGTGKTMASEVLANDLRLDLYRIDLSQVVNKYIGETEKNLKRIFDAAEEGGAILLFDEADALFGKRSEVKDSHDRYANIEVSYLLQRMETYRGLAILTTNMKSALDKAFLRRIRFVVQFPFPDAAHRAEIWRFIFPEKTPTDGLDLERLSRLNVAGGNIRNIALNAAFLAAEDGEPVRMSHLSRAARVEYAKIEKPMSNIEIGAW
jgi:AAA+ superfamily predicted ATPase